MDARKRKRKAFEFDEGHKRETRKSYQSYIEEAEKVQVMPASQIKIEDMMAEEGIRKSSRTPVPKKTFDLVDSFEEDSSRPKIQSSNRKLVPPDTANPITWAETVQVKQEPIDTDSDTAPRKSTRVPVPKKSFELIESGFEGFTLQQQQTLKADSTTGTPQLELKKSSKSKAQSCDDVGIDANVANSNSKRKKSANKDGSDKKQDKKRKDTANKETGKLMVKVDFKSKKDKANRKRKIDADVLTDNQPDEALSHDSKILAVKRTKTMQDNIDHSALLEALQALNPVSQDDEAAGEGGKNLQVREDSSSTSIPEKKGRKSGSKKKPSKRQKDLPKLQLQQNETNNVQIKVESTEEDVLFPSTSSEATDFSSSTTERSDGHIILKVGGLSSPTKVKKHKKKHKHHHHQRHDDDSFYHPLQNPGELCTTDESQLFLVQEQVRSGVMSIPNEAQMIKDEGTPLGVNSETKKKHKSHKKKKKISSLNTGKEQNELEENEEGLIVKKRKIYKKKKGEKTLVRIQTEYWNKFGELVKVEPMEVKESGDQSFALAKSSSKGIKKKANEKVNKVQMKDLTSSVKEQEQKTTEVDFKERYGAKRDETLVQKKIKKPASKKSSKSLANKKGSQLGNNLKNAGSITKKKKERKTQTLTAYLLYCRKYRQKVVAENPNMGFSEISRKLAQMWNEAPEKEKDIYKKQLEEHRAKVNATIRKETSKKLKTTKQAGQGSPSKGPNAPIQRMSSKEYQIAPQQYSVNNLEPVDMAAHLQLLGESLMLVSTALRRQVLMKSNDLKVYGSLSVLLDSSLCAMAPLLFLASSVPQLDVIPPEKKANILDNIAYILPGL